MAKYTVIRRVSKEVITVHRNKVVPMGQEAVKVKWSKETIKEWKQDKDNSCKLIEDIIRSMAKK